MMIKLGRVADCRSRTSVSAGHAARVLDYIRKPCDRQTLNKSWSACEPPTTKAKGLGRSQRRHHCCGKVGRAEERFLPLEPNHEFNLTVQVPNPRPKARESVIAGEVISLLMIDDEVCVSSAALR